MGQEAPALSNVTRNGHDPRLLSQEPGQCDLGRCRMLLCGDFADQVDQRLICFKRFRREARPAALPVRKPLPSGL